MQATTPMIANIRPLKSTFRKGVAEDPDASNDSAPERKSPERTKANQGMSHSNPTAPNKKNGGRQAPVPSADPTPSNNGNTKGVRIAPTVAPLWSRPLPSERCRSSSSERVIRTAQGQCPASKKPSRPRKIRRS